MSEYVQAMASACHFPLAMLRGLGHPRSTSADGVHFIGGLDHLLFLADLNCKCMRSDLLRSSCADATC